MVVADTAAHSSGALGATLLCAALCAAAGVPRFAHAATPPAQPAGAPTHYQPDRFSGRAGQFYRAVWGVDSLAIQWAESGELLRFSYRVLDADRARALSDKRAEPYVIDPAAGVKLVVPAMENVGPLRQSSPTEAGKSYWLTFSNKGRLVKRGDRVSVVIGEFHADGLVVD